MENENGNFFRLLENLHAWQIFIVALVIIVLYYVHKTGVVDKLFKQAENDHTKALKAEIEKIKTRSIEVGLKNIEAFAHHAVESLENCIGANYYVIHDGGEKLTEVKDWYLTVLRSTSFAVGTDYAEPQLMNKGFKWLNETARDKLYVYIPCTKKEENLRGLDGAYLHTQGIKSCAVALVKNELSAYHFVSLNFSIEEPIETNPDLRKVLMEFRREVRTNILDKD